MNCPKCGSECWDNAQKVATGWRGPLWKCKNQSCDWVQWPPKEKSAAPKRAQMPQHSGEPKWTWQSLRQTYQRSLVLAVKEVKDVATTSKVPYTMADVLAAAATIFIAASRDGVAELTPKPEEQPAGFES